MLTILANISAAAANVQSSAVNHVAALALYGLRNGVAKPSQRSMWEAATAGGLNSKTVYRHIGFAVAVVNTIKAKYPDHARIVELREANSTEAQFAAVTGFFADMGITGAAEAELWAKGDGLPLTVEKTATLRAEKAEKAKAAKSDTPLVAETTAEAELRAKAEADKAAAKLADAEAAKAKAEAEAEAAKVTPLAAAISALGAMDDAELAQLAAAINAERKARKAALAAAA